jgi:ribonuclease-3
MNKTGTIEERFRDLLGADVGEEVMALALTPRSSGAKNNNERLEFLGNAILNMRLAEAIYDRYPELPPGTMSLMCNYLRSNPVLVLVGHEGGLDSFIRKHQKDEGFKVTDKMVSTAFEAIIATIHKRSGYEAASKFIEELILTDYLVSDSMNGKGSITELKELVDRDRDIIVTHGRSEQNVDGKLVFSHTTTINGKTVTAEGRTKKIAETKAASKALALLRSEDVP